MDRRFLLATTAGNVAQFPGVARSKIGCTLGGRRVQSQRSLRRCSKQALLRAQPCAQAHLPTTRGFSKPV